MILCPYLKNPEVARDFEELKQATSEKAAYRIWSLNGGHGIDKAPNGAKSKLFLSLLEYYNGDRTKAIQAKAKTYGTSFLNWFGDWVTKTPQKNFEHSLFRGQAGKPRIDNNGNLVLHPTYDNLSKNTGISFANVEGAAIEYGSRYSKNPYIIEIDADYLDKTHPLKETTESKGRFIGDEYGENAWEERISDTEDIIIPKEYYKIKHDAPDFSELSDTELRAKIDELEELYDNQDEWADEAYAQRTSKSEIREYQEELDRRNKEYNKKYKTVYYDLKVNKTNSTVDSNSYTSNDAGESLYQLIYDNRLSYMITEEQYKDFVSGKDIIIKALKQEKRHDYVENASLLENSVSKVVDENSVSKVVDENGEPLVVWHGSKMSNEITTFHNIPTYFSDRFTAFSYIPFMDVEDETGYMYPAFLNIRNPKQVDGKGAYWNNIDGMTTDDIVKSVNEEDGVIIKDIKDYSDLAPGNPDLSLDLLEEAPLHTDYVITNPNQIKHIENQGPTPYEGTYSTENNDIYHSLPVRTNLREDVIKMLKDRHLVHGFMGLRTTKEESGDTIRERILSAIKGLPVAITFNTDGFSTTVDIIENITISEVGLDEIARSNDKNIREIVSIIRFLQERFPNIRIVKVDKDHPFPEGTKPNANAVVKNGVIYIDFSRVNTEQTVEEFLHPLVYTILYNNLPLFQSLLYEAQKLFPKLWAEILNTYTDKDGFDRSTRENELVTQALSRYVRIEKNDRNRVKTFKELVKKFFNYIGACILAAIEKINGTYVIDPEKLPRMKLSDLAKLVTLDNVLFKTWNTDLIMHSISTKQLAYEETSDKLIMHMLKLYQTYDKIPNKSIKRQIIAGRIFETYNKMKQYRDTLSVSVAIDFAILNLGVYEDLYDGPNPALNTVYNYLVEQKKVDFNGINPQRLVEIYRFSIKFYERMISDIPVNKLDLSSEDKAKINQIKSTLENFIKPLWVEAMIKVGDDIVNENIDTEVVASDYDKEQMKIVAKDWLHKNLMYGDISPFLSYAYNNSYSENPIIKLIFHMILHAELKTLEEMLPIGSKIIKAYQDTDKVMSSLSGNWQSLMMEFNEDGIPTGNFVRDINYGQYEQDLINFRKRLNDLFIEDYGYTYVEDDTGLIVNSVTGEVADNEEWGPDGEEPTYIKYLKKIEKFRCERANRRWNLLYYMERMSRPYDGEMDPSDPNFDLNEYNHGLSPRTLSRYRYFTSNINFYLNKCTNEKGLTYPEKLSKEDRQQLDYWQSQLEDLSNPFTKSGHKKSGEELKMAYEIRAWLKFISDRTGYNELQNLFDIEYQLAESDGNLYNFLKYNASIAINPDYIKLTIWEFRKNPYTGAEAVRASIIDKSLRALISDPFKFEQDLYKMENNIQFWLECKRVDDVLKDAERSYTQDPDYAKNMEENFDKYFINEEIIYRDENGFAFDINGNRVRKEDENKVDQNGNKLIQLLTFREHLIFKYTKEAFETGFIQGLYTKNGTLYSFSGKSYTEVRALITRIFTYLTEEENEDGSITTHQHSLNIFKVLKPTYDTFYNKRTNRTEKTIWYLPKNRFSVKDSSFVNTEYDFTSGIAEQPKRYDDEGNKLYDNSEAFDKVKNNPKLKALYDILILTMKDSQQLYHTRNRTFNYRLPQIEARTAALLSRLINSGWRSSALTGLWDLISTILENDDEMRVSEDHYIGVDGEVANDVPLKFVHRLKNPGTISTDVVSSVILFANMAHNYKNKSEIDNKIKALSYNMQDENREIADRNAPADERKSQSNANSVKMLRSMLNKHMYGNNWEDNPTEGGPTKTKVAWKKLNRQFLTLESTQMLGLNIFSMSVGFGDSLTRILTESAAGKYMTIGDVMFSLGYCIIKTPEVLMNLGNPLANNKITALMQLFGISKGIEQTYSHTNWGKAKKIISNLLMGGFSMLDWMANALLLISFMHNSRFIDEIKDEDGNVIVQKGFYTKYELQQAFLNAGLTVSQANAVHHNWKNFGKRITLFDAYEFQPWEDFTDENGNTVRQRAIGQVKVKDEYAPYVTDVIKTRIATKTKKRGALYNGMNPDNDTPRWKQGFIGSLVGALRSWMAQQIQHLVAGGTDNVVREFEEVPHLIVEAGKTKNRPKYKKKELSEEDKLRRFSYDYETGTPQDQIIVCLYRGFKTLFKSIMKAAMLKPQKAKFSRTEKYAFKDAVYTLAMLGALITAFVNIWGDLPDIPKPKNREEAGPKTWWNPVDYGNFFVDQYIPNLYYKLGTADVLFRIIESKISNMNPKQAYDIVKSITALASGMEDQLGLITLVPDMFSDEDEMNSIVKTGGYKFYTKGEKVLYRSIGPVKNLHTFMTYYGMDSNLRYYTNMYGKLFRLAGFDFSRKSNVLKINNDYNYNYNYNYNYDYSY